MSQRPSEFPPNGNGMAQVMEKVKEAVLDTKKVRDLARDTADPQGVGLTTDRGSAVLDTDTWLESINRTLAKNINHAKRLKVTDGTHGPGPALLEDEQVTTAEYRIASHGLTGLHARKS